MSESEDPHALADKLEEEADRLEGENRELAQETEDVAQDWQRKREDESVPGAVPPPGSDDEEATESPAPQAPPEGAGPSQSDTAANIGPPKSTLDEAEQEGESGG